MTITVTCYSWAPSSGDHLFTCGAIFWPPQCLQTLGQITFAHKFPLRTDFPTTASLRTVVRCFVNLNQLDDLTQNDSIKRLALPNVICEVNSIM